MHGGPVLEKPEVKDPPRLQKKVGFEIRLLKRVQHLLFLFGKLGFMVYE